MATQIRRKKKFVADGIFYAELNEVLTRELAEDGYVGAEVRCFVLYLPSSNIRQIIVHGNLQGGFAWRYLFLTNLHQTLISY
ncbi:hypothetical protein BRARA_D02015 [Brassica rapa]|uniref:Uncharacterized protein n=1 Tax=Brassica campestris TaxID=3711 RepID=A0A397ZRB9_BRACM|nr:hypothetical protein BRARA_D02015 [Brassica rapa]